MLPHIHSFHQQALLEQLQALHNISFMLWRTDSINQLLFTAVDEAKKQLDIDRMAIFLFDEKLRMHGTYGTDMTGATVDEHYFESAIPDHWFSSHALKGQEYIVINDNTELYHDLEPVGAGWNAYVALWDEDKAVGWIACDNLISGRPLKGYHRQLLKQFGFIVSQHLVRRQAEEKLIRLNKELEHRVTERTQALQSANQQLELLAKCDPLTGVANRRAFDCQFKDEWRRAERHQLPLSLLIIDIDNFKSYNDQYGHAAGDQCLQVIASALNTIERRAGALFARYGGEEFVLLLPGQNHKAAVYAAKQALHAVRRLKLKHKQPNDASYVTISIGVASINPSLEHSTSSLFKLTDDALYKAKALGKNGYYFHTPTESDGAHQASK